MWSFISGHWHEIALGIDLYGIAILAFYLWNAGREMNRLAAAVEGLGLKLERVERQLAEMRPWRMTA